MKPAPPVIRMRCGSYSASAECPLATPLPTGSAMALSPLKCKPEGELWCCPIRHFEQIFRCCCDPSKQLAGRLENCCWSGRLL